MNESINTDSNLNPEELKRLEKERQDREDAELLKDYLARHPAPVISPEQSREAGPEIAKLEEMIISFESMHSLEELRSIVDLSPDLATVFEFAQDISRTPEELEHSLRHVTKVEPEYARIQRAKITAAKAVVLTPEDRRIYEMRTVAKEGLTPIVAILNTLEQETNISLEKFDELKKKCKVLMKAVGSLASNKISHK